MWRRWSVLATTAVAATGIQTAQAAETSNKPAQTEEVTVTGEAIGSLTSESPEESAKQKTQLPGDLTIKTADEMKLRRASNFEHLLQRAPGVFLQSENGVEVSKISIRGSGITSENEPLGVMFLLDALNNLVEFSEGPDSSVVYAPLQPQHAWTIEIGTRGEIPRVQWELSLYRSWLRNELLELNDRFGNDIGTTNVPRSVNRGIQASLEVELLGEIFIPKQANRQGDRLSFDQSYALNDFHFEGGPVYGDNRIARIPIHVYEAQLLYEMPSSFYAGPNLRCDLSPYPVDQANTLFADSYALLGFRV